MSITITKHNIDEYRSSGANLLITEVRWQAGNLASDILILFPNLTTLDCSDNDIFNLNAIEACTKLEVLNCDRCKITSLEPLRSCVNLRVLSCVNNHIQSLTGIECCIQLQELYCSSNRISSLKHLELCPMLEILKCSSNDLESMDGIQNCSHVRTVVCCYNKLSTLTHIRGCTSLIDLDCSDNRLRSIELEECINLRRLECDGNKLDIQSIRCAPSLRILSIPCSIIGRMNKLITLDGIERFEYLEELYCQRHRLTSLAGIERCQHLRKLNCSSNKLKTLAGVEQCHLLRELVCSDNQLKTLDQIVYLQHLTTISVWANPLRTLSLQVERFMNRLQNVNRDGSVYMDKQNVHDTYVQKTVRDSIQRLLTDPKPVFDLESMLESNLSEHTKQRIVEYCGDRTVHSVHLLTYAELLAYVWARIVKSEHKDELVGILDEQIQDAECLCFTGRFNRTLSVLVGFCEDIVISISDNSRISAIVIAARTMPEACDPAQHRVIAQDKLLEAGYNLDQVQPWLDAICERE